MTRGPDAGLRALLRRHLTPMGFHVVSVETPGTGRGVPDVNVCRDGVECWIECKRTTGLAVRMRPEQVAWLLARERRGGRTWIAVRRLATAGARRSAADELYLVRGHYAREVAELGLVFDPARMLCWRGGPARWDWAEVAAALLGSGVD